MFFMSLSLFKATIRPWFPLSLKLKSPEVFYTYNLYEEKENNW